MTCGCISDWSAIRGGEDEEEEKITITSSIDFLNLHSTQKKILDIDRNPDLLYPIIDYKTYE